MLPRQPPLWTSRSARCSAPSGGTPGRDWTRRCGAATRSTVTGSRYRKLDDRAEARLIALACTPAPEGRDHWTLRALAGKTVELGLVESLSHETVRLRLKKGSQAVAQEAVAHPEGERRLRGPHGGCAGTLRRAL